MLENIIKIIRRRQYSYLLGIALVLALFTVAVGYQNVAVAQDTSPQEANQTDGDSRLDIIKARGYLVCGVSGELPGFSYIDRDGMYAGLDVDICRAISAAIFDDPTKVKFRNLSAAERFDVLKAGEIDLLSRNTTQTFSRDTDGRIEFTPTTFHDAQGIMVNKASSIKSSADLAKKAICVVANTTSYDNLQDYMQSQSIPYQPRSSENASLLFDDYEHNRCQAITGDVSQLVARKTLLANPQDHQILNTISQEPLAPAVLHQDSQWYDAVKWITYALIQAEELDITSENISIYKSSKDSEIQRFLGIESNLGSSMGLSNDFTVRVVKHVGNYGEIYDRNIGQRFGLARNNNALWENGGLMYSPPFR